MPHTIDRDNQRFKKIMWGKVRPGLKVFITHGKILGRNGARGTGPAVSVEMVEVADVKTPIPTAIAIGETTL